MGINMQVTTGVFGDLLRIGPKKRPAQAGRVTQKFIGVDSEFAQFRGKYLFRLAFVLNF